MIHVDCRIYIYIYKNQDGIYDFKAKKMTAENLLQCLSILLTLKEQAKIEKKTDQILPTVTCPITFFFYL